MTGSGIKPPPDRLYGRVKGKKLRPRQEWLLENFLPSVAWPAAPFDNKPNEIWLEVGFGGGEHAHALSLANPDIGIIAAEVFENGICSLLSRLAPDEVINPTPPPNLRLYTDDARPLIRTFPNAFLTKLFLMFPDPWPKARHTKRRFVHPAILPEIARVLVTGGEWRIASDDPTYQNWTDEVIAGQSLFTTTRTPTRPEGWPPTRYEAKAVAAGRQPVYWSLQKL
jgi:tRNA (guanine-N7-)-methyltransferase